MSAFRRVDGAQAGPDALGILVPPGRRTFVIVRPRGLAWDLLPLGTDGASFLEVGVGEAADLARELRQVFEDGPGDLPIRVEPMPAADGAGYQVRAALGPCSWLACLRTPGQPYRPAEFSTLDAALGAAGSLMAALCPGEGTVREFYFNTHHFGPKKQGQDP